MVDSPRISVITCVYNGERYLAQAIESILAQTDPNFEYILVDDASKDDSGALIQRYARRDARLVVLRNPANLNPSGALNRALQVAQGEYLAILDQDDLALPERLARQRAFLDEQPAFFGVGAQVLTIDPTGRVLAPMDFPTTAAEARWRVLFGSPVLHSALMLRRGAVQQAGGYSAQQWYVNDYILVTQLMRTGAVASLPQTLTLYRRHPQQTAGVYQGLQRGQALLLIYSLLEERLQLRAPLGEIVALYDGNRGNRLADLETLQRAVGLLERIRARYLEAENPNDQTREQVDHDCARRLCILARTHRLHLHAAAQSILRRAVQLDPQLGQHRQARRHAQSVETPLLEWLNRTTVNNGDGANG